MQRHLTGLFPTPLARIEGLLEPDLITAVRDAALEARRRDNSATDLLSHTAMVDPSADPLFDRLARAALPEVVRFGDVLFGETLRWGIKEMWMNVLQAGGSQFMHSHANSFVSGIFYLTEAHPSARTVFLRRVGGDDFRFKNDSERARTNPYNSERWVPPEIAPGDLLLYPSYLIHGVPPNQGGERVTVAFNAIPDQLDSQGYRIRFAPP